MGGGARKSEHFADIISGCPLRQKDGWMAYVSFALRPPREKLARLHDIRHAHHFTVISANYCAVTLVPVSIENGLLNNDILD